jgi:ribose transport system ATP-binding protein
MTAPLPAIEGRDVSKSFGGVKALDRASFVAEFGEVHALVGENGAGKSTLIKVLSGVLRPDSGSILVRGKDVHLGGPQDAHALGIATVFQELTLFPWLNVAENLFIGREPRSRIGLIDRRTMESEAERILAEFGVEGVNPLSLVADLSLGHRQILEIIRAVLRNPQVLFLDEPTSSLGAREVEWLFTLVRRLREQGKCIIFTSHRWAEVEHIADRVTIFRNGRHVGTFREIDEGEAVALMTGRHIEAFYVPIPPLQDRTPVLEVRSLTGPGVQGVSLVLHRGEILGIGGLAGHGHRELFLMLFGAIRPTSGKILIEGRETILRSPRDAIHNGLGIALVPEDRKTQGLFLPMSIRDNLTLPILHQISHAGIVRRRHEFALVRHMIDSMQIHPGEPERPVKTLSGGNQQKVLVGRWLLANSRILLLYDVTRGVDIATKHDLYELIGRLSREGRAILFYSSDTEEIARLCHRVIVLRQGRTAAELQGPGISAEAIVAAAIREPAQI